MSQLCPPLRRKMPRFGRSCSASTSCRLSARRPSVVWRSKCGHRDEQGSQGSTPSPLRRWACPGRSWVPAKLPCQVGRGLPGDPGRAPTSRRSTQRGISPVPKRVGLCRVPLQESASSTPWGPGTLPGGLLGGRRGYWTWDHSLRTPTCRRGHRQYLHSGPPYDFPRYRSKVHEVTQVFAAASREVLAVEAELAGPRAQPLLAGHVRNLQQLEQTRLATVRPPPASARTPKRGLSPRWPTRPTAPLGARSHILALNNPAPRAPDTTFSFSTSVFH